MTICSKRTQTALARTKSEQAKLAGYSAGSAFYDDLRALSMVSADQLRGRTLLTDADLYDEHGLPT